MTIRQNITFQIFLKGCFSTGENLCAETGVILLQILVCRAHKKLELWVLLYVFFNEVSISYYIQTYLSVLDTILMFLETEQHSIEEEIYHQMIDRQIHIYVYCTLLFVHYSHYCMYVHTN